MFIDPKRIPSTGDPLLDAQHSRLAQVANRAYEQWRSNLPIGVWRETLAEFRRMQAEHYSTEEAELRRVGFPGLAQHAERHGRLLDQVGQVCESLKSGNIDAVAVFDALDRMLYDHEVLEDQDFWGAFAVAPQPDWALIEWSETLELGIPGIDRAHRLLVEMVNRLASDIAARESREVVARGLAALRAHAAIHFADEEAVMHRLDTPGQEAHRTLHRNLLSELDATIRGLPGMTGRDLDHLGGEVLKYWLLDHVMHVDSRIRRK